MDQDDLCSYELQMKCPSFHKLKYLLDYEILQVAFIFEIDFYLIILEEWFTINFVGLSNLSGGSCLVLPQCRYRPVAGHVLRRLDLSYMTHHPFPHAREK